MVPPGRRGSGGAERQPTRRPHDDHMNTSMNPALYKRRGKASGGPCPESLDNCISLCPSQVGGQLYKKKIGRKVQSHQKSMSINSRIGFSRRVWPTAADGATRDNILVVSDFNVGKFHYILFYSGSSAGF